MVGIKCALFLGPQSGLYIGAIHGCLVSLDFLKSIFPVQTINTFGCQVLRWTHYIHFLCEPMLNHQPISRMQPSVRSAETKASSAMFPSLQEYCKFKNTEDSAFPSVYIGLKDKLSGIRKVITDSTAHLIRLLQDYKETLEDFSKEGERLSGPWAVVCVPQSG